MTHRLLLVGNPGAQHVGAHFLDAARELGWETRLLDLTEAYRGPSWKARVNWWLRGRLPLRLDAFSEDVVAACRDFRPDWLLSTGIAPISHQALAAIGEMGVARWNFLTDDPWNPAHHALWFFRAARHYDHIFSPRRANLRDLEELGDPRISYLPFAYSPAAHFPEAAAAPVDGDVVFIGGGDRDRFPPVVALIEAGLRIALYGGYWDRDSRTRPFARGFLGPRELRQVTGAAPVVLGLVRRGNRDGHSMRSYEVPAMRGCLLTEDTEEHREMFGDEGEAVLYFRDHAELVQQARRLIDDEPLRRRLAAAAHARITGGANTYRDRLEAMVHAHESKPE